MDTVDSINPLLSAGRWNFLRFLVFQLILYLLLSNSFIFKFVGYEHNGLNWAWSNLWFTSITIAWYFLMIFPFVAKYAWTMVWSLTLGYNFSLYFCAVLVSCICICELIDVYSWGFSHYERTVEGLKGYLCKERRNRWTMKFVSLTLSLAIRYACKGSLWSFSPPPTIPFLLVLAFSCSVVLGRRYSPPWHQYSRLPWIFGYDTSQKCNLLQSNLHSNHSQVIFMFVFSSWID